MPLQAQILALDGLVVEGFYVADVIYQGSLQRVWALTGRPNGVRYRRLGREKLGNGKPPKLRTSPKKRTESQPSGARCVRQPVHVEDPDTPLVFEHPPGPCQKLI